MDRTRAQWFSIAIVLGAFASVPAQDRAFGGLLITIDKASQRMIVAKDDLPLHDWPVSTGQRGYDTPVGVYRPFRMEADHFSREWDDAPMPHSIFFTQIGHAIHGSLDVKRLGRPASHGCVRLKPEHAEMLFKLVRAEKMANTRVVLTGLIPGGGAVPHILGNDPYAADEALAGWTPPAAVIADANETTGSIPRMKRAERTRSHSKRVERRYYEPPQRSFADVLFHGIR